MLQIIDLKNKELFTQVSSQESITVSGGQIIPGVNAPLIADPLLQNIFANDPLLGNFLQTSGSTFFFNPAGPINFPTDVILRSQGLL